MVFTIYDQRSSLGGLLPGPDTVLIDGIFNLLKLRQRIQIGRLPLLFQLLADIGLAGQAPGSFSDLGLDGKFSLQAFQLSFLSDGKEVSNGQCVSRSAIELVSLDWHPVNQHWINRKLWINRKI